MVTDALHAKGIDYHYEIGLQGQDRVERYPDFTVEDPATGITIYWEHLGMLSDLAYRRRFADGARRLLAPVSAVILGPRLECPVDAIVSWHPEGDLLSHSSFALHIAAIYRIPVLNLATDSPREVCKFLRDLRPLVPLRFL